jgi:hypothetical protein
MKPFRIRVAQFFGALRPEMPPDGMRTAEGVLEPAQMSLFRRMGAWDQCHSLEVYRRLVDAGQTERSLLQAALLHDVGKSLAPVTVWHRVAVVLLHALRPGWLKRISAARRGWRYPISVLVHHADIGARLAKNAKSRPEVVVYIRQHDNRLATGPVAWLRWADGQITQSSEVKVCPRSPSSEQV